MIGHSLLNPTLTLAAMDEGIQMAIDYRAASVSILPHGGHTTAINIKLAETRQALAVGAWSSTSAPSSAAAGTS